MNARYYDAVTGRFISQDSYRGETEDAGTWHLYAYCANNPINYVDPTGHIATAIVKGVATIFASVSVGQVAVLGAICVRAFLAVKGYQKWQPKTKIEVRKVITKIAINTVITSFYTVEYIKGLVDTVAKAKVATKYGKDEKHHIVAKKAKRVKDERDLLEEKNISLESSNNKITLDYRLHRRLHRNTYYDFVNWFVTKRPKWKANIYTRLATIKATLYVANKLVKAA